MHSKENFSTDIFSILYFPIFSNKIMLISFPDAFLSRAICENSRSSILIRVGRGFYEPEKVKEILEARDRKAAGITAPPQGLMLMKIEYK